MPRFLTLMVLTLVLTASLAEAKSKRIQVTAEVVQQTFTGNPADPSARRPAHHQCRAA